MMKKIFWHRTFVVAGATCVTLTLIAAVLEMAGDHAAAAEHYHAAAQRTKARPNAGICSAGRQPSNPTADRTEDHTARAGPPGCIQ